MTPSELHAALQQPVTVDLFDGETGLVNAHRVTIARTPYRVMLTTSTGITGALIAVEPHPTRWYLRNLVATGFVATVHGSDLVFL